MSLGIVVQARLGSSRLPSKITEEITPGCNVLEFLIRPLVSIGLPVVIAFPDTPEHRQLSMRLNAGNVSFFFGPEFDVHRRFVDAGQYFGFTSVVRVCGDNPFLNMNFVKNLIGEWNEDLDYLSYFDKAGRPAMKTHYGLFAEIARLSALESIRSKTTDAYYLEHVTPYFYEHPAEFHTGRLAMPEPFWSGAPLRFTLDTKEDLETLRSLAAAGNIQELSTLIALSGSQVIRLSMEAQILRNSK